MLPQTKKQTKKQQNQCQLTKYYAHYFLTAIAKKNNYMRLIELKFELELLVGEYEILLH